MAGQLVSSYKPRAVELDKLNIPLEWRRKPTVEFPLRQEYAAGPFCPSQRDCQSLTQISNIGFPFWLHGLTHVARENDAPGSEQTADVESGPESLKSHQGTLSLTPPMEKRTIPCPATAAIHTQISTAKQDGFQKVSNSPTLDDSLCCMLPSIACSRSSPSRNRTKKTQWQQ